MNKPSEILDENLGKLSLVDESSYLAEVPWNRELRIQLLIHVDGKDPRQCIENAWGVFLAVRKNEMALLTQGVDAAGVSELAMDEFLDNELVERVIEILPNGEGRLVYFLFMLGRFTVEFSRDALFTEAFAMPS